MTSPNPSPVAKATKYTIHGGLASGEIWNTGFWVVDTGPGLETLTAFTAQANAVKGKFTAHLQSQLNHMLSATDSLLGIRAAYYEGEASPKYALEMPIAGQVGTGTGNLPLQSSLVASLRTEGASRSTRGRMYFPATGIVLNQHQASDADAQDLASSVKDMFADINSIGGTGTGPLCAVMSATTQSWLPIELVVVDTRIDTQRRRANRQAIRVIKTATVGGGG